MRSVYIFSFLVGLALAACGRAYAIAANRRACCLIRRNKPRTSLDKLVGMIIQGRLGLALDDGDGGSPVAGGSHASGNIFNPLLLGLVRDGLVTLSSRLSKCRGDFSNCQAGFLQSASSRTRAAPVYSRLPLVLGAVASACPQGSSGN